MNQNTLRYEVPGSKPGVVHVVQMSDRDDTLYCPCPAWRFQAGRPAAERKDCKHIRKVLDDLGIE